MEFRVGQRVVCISNGWDLDTGTTIFDRILNHFFPASDPVPGKIYVVTGALRIGEHRYLRLHGMRNEYRSDGFRPLVQKSLEHDLARFRDIPELVS